MTELEKLEQETAVYINEEINWGAYKNEVIKTANKSEAAKDDVEQFASDAFFYGWQAAKKHFECKP
jgi:hypothetical protein